jgi:hypothetical protein
MKKVNPLKVATKEFNNKMPGVCWLPGLRDLRNVPYMMNMCSSLVSKFANFDLNPTSGARSSPNFFSNREKEAALQPLPYSIPFTIARPGDGPPLQFV